MASARESVDKDMPSICSDPKSNKERLTNDVLRFFEAKECKFP